MSGEFTDPVASSAVAGYIAVKGFDGIPEADIPRPEDFVGEWRPVIAAAVALHRAGKHPNHITINDEIPRLNLEREMRGHFEDQWEGWPAYADPSLTFSTQAIIECLRKLRRLGIKREGCAVGKSLFDGDIDPQEAARQLTAISESSQAVSLASILAARRFDPSSPPPMAHAIFELGAKTIATPGNLLALTAKAKAGKTGAISAFIGATLGKRGDTLSIRSANPDGRAVIHFDTEQSPFDHHLVAATGLKRVGVWDRPDWLRSYRVVDVPMGRRLELLQFELKAAQQAHGGVHSVILDGVADFLPDPNDPVQAFALVEKLHLLAVQFNTTIINVLHLNPGTESGKSRGHLGSQLERKAESNLMIEKDGDGISTMFTTVSRHAYVPKQDGPRFQWNEAEGMHVSVECSRVAEAKAEDEALRQTADEVFAKGPLRWSEMIEGIKGCRGIVSRQAERLVKKMKDAGLVANHGAGKWVRL